MTIVDMIFNLFFYVLVIFVLYWFSSRWLRSKKRLDPIGKAVFVSGCDSGFGHGIAIRLDTLGFHVYAGCLFADGEGSKTLRKKCSNRLHILNVDVRKDEDVKAAVKKIKEDIAEENIQFWGVVNNAGVSVYGLVEWCTVEMYQRVLDVNLIGMIRVTKAFLPLLRKSKGRVVNMGSVMCRSAYQAFSSYAISKHGVEAFTRVLRKEVKDFGIRVCILEPGNFLQATSLYTHDKVNTIADELWTIMDDEQKTVYKDRYDFIVKIMHDSLNGQSYSNVTPVVDCIEDALLAEYPRMRYLPQELIYQLLGFAITHLPEELTDKIGF